LRRIEIVKKAALSMARPRDDFTHVSAWRAEAERGGKIAVLGHSQSLLPLAEPAPRVPRSETAPEFIMGRRIGRRSIQSLTPEGTPSSCGIRGTYLKGRAKKNAILPFLVVMRTQP
jgi:hypothetical protein